MKTGLKILCILIWLLPVGCNKLEMTGPDEDKNEEVKPGEPTEESGAISVCELSEITDDEWVSVKGYIVGCVPGGNKLSNVNFDLSEVTNTNIVLCDDPLTNDWTLCAACQLVSGGDAREGLNLADNPDMLGAYVVIEGNKGKYFGAPGVRNVKFYQLIEESGSEIPEPDPDTPDENDLSYPEMSHEEAEVFEGI